MRLKSIFEKIKIYASSFWRQWIQDKRKVMVSIVFLVMLLVFLILGAVSKNMAASLPDQQEADRWSDDMRMAQVSIFITQDRMVTEEDMKRFAYNLEKKLADAGVMEPEDEEQEEDKLQQPEIVDTISLDSIDEQEPVKPLPEKTWLQKKIAMAASAQGQAVISYENKTLENTSVIGVTGDFFFFHPLTRINGSYFGGDDLMKDGIVIDEDTAWNLFGSTDVVGLSVDVGDVPHYVVGVVKKETGRIQKAAGLTNNYVYMSLESLSRYGSGILSGKTDSVEISEDGATALTGGINCIEVVCPNPVNGLAAKAATESLGFDENSVVVVDNTERFSPFALFKVLKSFGLRSMWGKAIFYPYWENIARGYEDILAVLFLLRAVALLTMAAIITVTVINLYRHKKWTVRGIYTYLSEKKYDLEVTINKRKMEKKALKAEGTADGGEE
jgi:hypothetical protein